MRKRGGDSMCCGYDRHHPYMSCGCCFPYRRFPSVDEEREVLKRYKKDLENEIAEIEKRIEELKKQGN